MRRYFHPVSLVILSSMIAYKAVLISCTDLKPAGAKFGMLSAVNEFVAALQIVWPAKK